MYSHIPVPIQLQLHDLRQIHYMLFDQLSKKSMKQKTYATIMSTTVVQKNWKETIPVATDIPHLASIAFVANKIENRLLSCDEIGCDLCIKTFVENEKMDAQFCISEEKKTCKSTFQLCKLTDTAIKTLSHCCSKSTFKQIFTGLKHIHDNRIIHCDIKLENVFVDHRGVARIGDFGLSVRCDSHRANANGEIPLANQGTILYLSPELITRNMVSFKSDVWAVAVMAYIMRLGLAPFYGFQEEVTLKLIEDINYQ